jgi:imidazoleglycerol-phosphate dehydratase / histidinol-phosphatase
MAAKFAFIDRDGTLINEPPQDYQVDSFEKLALEVDVIPALLQLQQADYRLVLVSNQDGLGTTSFPTADFTGPHQLMLQIFASQGIQFEAVLICPHFLADNCACRKPRTKLITDWLADQKMDTTQSVVIGDWVTDIELATNLGISGLRYHPVELNWSMIASQLTDRNRYACIERRTHETNIKVEVWLDQSNTNHIDTSIGFFDHMLEQIATHAGIRLVIQVQGDLHIDDHHTVEDTGLALGTALKQALGDKRGIARFGFELPMDECLARCALDISGRPWLEYKAEFKHQHVGDLSTEMIQHFFHSLAYSMACTLHLLTKGQNDHHRAESLFKVFGRTLRQAIRVEGNLLPSSKGVL